MTPRVEHLAEGVTLYCGDCRDIVPTLARPDAVISDPPYGQAYKPQAAHRLNGIFRGPLRSAYPGMMLGDGQPFCPQLLLASADIVLLWGAHKFGSRLPDGTLLVWDKVPTGKIRDQGDAEAAWLNRIGPMRMFRHLWDGVCMQRGSEETARQPGGSAQTRRVHPTQKPVALMRWSIERAKVPPGGVILDAYMGSGSTGVAAIQTGHRFVGIELDPRHFDTACRRIAAEIARAPKP